MLSSAGYPPNSLQNLQLNTLADGLFHAGTWLVTLIGIVMLWRAARRRPLTVSGTVLVGTLAMGWGLFNLVEGIINHHILKIHHVRAGPNELAYDLAYLAFGALLFAVGAWLVQRERAQSRLRAPTTAAG